MKEFIIVGIGSFFGGGLRYLISRITPFNATANSFPWATFFTNIIGCFLIGIFTAIFLHNSNIDNSLKLLLTTGFCGGFTTFSTFINESTTLLKGDDLTIGIIYIVASLAIGILALIAGKILIDNIL